MTDNFTIIEQYMRKNGIPELTKDSGDAFFCVMLVRRGKDHKDLPSANYTFKSYYIDSIEALGRYEEEIVKCCNLFGLRAYVSVNVKSKERYSKHLLEKLSTNILNGEYKKPWRMIDHCFGKTEPMADKTWIIDIDEEYLLIENYIDNLYSIINGCKSQYENPIIATIPTKSGYHLLVRPFDLYDFFEKHNKLYDGIVLTPEVKKDHITLLYENIEL